MIQGGGPFPYNFDVQIALPADAREMSENLSDLINPNKWKAKDGNRYLWKGMRTYVKSESMWYELIANPEEDWEDPSEPGVTKKAFQNPDNWVQKGGDSISSITEEQINDLFPEEEPEV